MPIFIAMFRGINLGGYKLIKMEQLRRCFADLGFNNVRTYVQSGNVVFEACEAVARLSAKIDKRIREEFGFEAPVRSWKTTRALLSIAQV